MSKGFFLYSALVVLLFQHGLAQQAYTGNANTIKIGLLVNDQTSFEAQNAAELAVRLANEKARANGNRFQLITRSMEGAWGTGSNEAVNLVFEERVWAILGSHDSRNAHLVEQVIAKTKVVFLSAWASDPTLSQAFIPWFYNCVPNDIQQAEVLIQEMVKNKKIQKIAVIVQENYDAEKALKSVKDELQRLGYPDSYVSRYTFCSEQPEACIKKIQNDAHEAVVLLGDGESSWALLDLLRKKGLGIPVYGTISMLGAHNLRQVESETPLNLTVLNSGNWMKSNTLDSQNKPSGSDDISNATAAYAFDGINVLIDAIKSCGFNRDTFNETMAKTNKNGITGNIQFDKNGNRRNTLNLVKIANNPISIKY
jgi:branched-chain amino acid transport system substrate-binding protein